MSVDDSNAVDGRTWRPDDVTTELHAHGLSMPTEGDREEVVLAYARSYLAEAKKQAKHVSVLSVPWGDSVHARACDREANFYQSHCFCGRRLYPASSFCHGHMKMSLLESELRSIHSNPIEWAISSPDLLEEARKLRRRFGRIRKGDI